jgi:superoxide dismutase, Fe-Mn family
MAFKLPDLPFERDALEPFMSAETLDFHHGKHHKAYVEKTNTLLSDKDLKAFGAGSLTEVVRKARESGDSKLFNNAAQIWNHSFFWQCLAPKQGQKPGGKLARMIDEGFGSADDMLKKLHEEAVNHFASGWAWLVLDRDTLKITSLHDADTPVVHDGWCRCSRSMCGSTPITSTIATSGRVSPRRCFPTSSTGTLSSGTSTARAPSADQETDTTGVREKGARSSQRYCFSR